MGRLIVIEGLDGSGKATQTNLLRLRLANEEKDFVKVSFPDYESSSSALVRMYLDGELGDDPDDVNAYAASSFYAVDRYASFKRYWQKAYNAGKLIIADRYTTSNAIYQLAKLEKKEWDSFLSWIKDYEYNKLGIPSPDIVFYLDVPLSVSQKLLSYRYDGDEKRKDIHEKNMSFLEKCHESAKYCAKKLNWRIINCCENMQMRPAEDIQKEISEVLNAEFQNCGD